MKGRKAMRGLLQKTLDAETERESSATASRSEATALAKRFPLVHRTEGSELTKILGDRRLRSKLPCTEREIECGIPSAIYFFLGCGAYPEGSVAFLASQKILSTSAATYTPFDTGALEKHASPRDCVDPWSEHEKKTFLGNYLGEGADAVEFAGEYVAAHFARAADYVCRPQQSEPDFPTYHGLVSASADRRAWSIEVQLHEDFDLEAANLDAIVLGQHDLLKDLPDDLIERVVIAEEEGALAPVIQQTIIGQEQLP